MLKKLVNFFSGAWLLYIGGFAIGAAILVGIAVNITDTTQDEKVHACAWAAGIGLIVGSIVWGVKSARYAKEVADAKAKQQADAATWRDVSNGNRPPY